MQEDVKKEVIETISNLTKIPLQDIDPTINFRDAGLDSFALVEVVFAIENKYDITFPQEGLLDITTVNQFVVFIEKIIKEKEEGSEGAKDERAAS